MGERILDAGGKSVFFKMFIFEITPSLLIDYNI